MHSSGKYHYFSVMTGAVSTERYRPATFESPCGVLCTNYGCCVGEEAHYTKRFWILHLSGLWRPTIVQGRVRGHVQGHPLPAGRQCLELYTPKWTFGFGTAVGAGAAGADVLTAPVFTIFQLALTSHILRRRHELNSALSVWILGWTSSVK